MRVSKAEKDRSHARIVDSAARLFRERGLENTSVADVMTAAQMTHGGFYRHFETKDALVETALGAAFEQIAARLDPETGDSEAAVTAFATLYLSKGHLDNPGVGCPIAALAGEVGRGAEGLKAAFGRGVNQLVDRLAAGMPGAETQRRERAIRQLAMMAGAIMIARASDPATGRAVLSACRAKGSTP